MALFVERARGGRPVFRLDATTAPVGGGDLPAARRDPARDRAGRRPGPGHRRDRDRAAASTSASGCSRGSAAAATPATARCTTPSAGRTTCSAPDEQRAVRRAGGVRRISSTSTPPSGLCRWRRRARPADAAHRAVDARRAPSAGRRARATSCSRRSASTGAAASTTTAASSSSPRMPRTSRSVARSVEADLRDAGRERGGRPGRRRLRRPSGRAALRPARSATSTPPSV